MKTSTKAGRFKQSLVHTYIIYPRTDKSKSILRNKKPLGNLIPVRFWWPFLVGPLVAIISRASRLQEWGKRSCAEGERSGITKALRNVPIFPRIIISSERDSFATTQQLAEIYSEKQSVPLTLSPRLLSLPDANMSACHVCRPNTLSRHVRASAPSPRHASHPSSKCQEPRRHMIYATYVTGSPAPFLVEAEDAPLKENLFP